MKWFKENFEISPTPTDEKLVPFNTVYDIYVEDTQNEHEFVDLRGFGMAAKEALPGLKSEQKTVKYLFVPGENS